MKRSFRPQLGCFGRAVDETEHFEHTLSTFNVRHGRCHRSHEIASRSMEGGIAAMPVNLLEHPDHALTQFTRRAVTADARRQFEHFGRHHTTPPKVAVNAESSTSVRP